MVQSCKMTELKKKKREHITHMSHLPRLDVDGHSRSRGDIFRRCCNRRNAGVPHLVAESSLSLAFSPPVICCDLQAARIGGPPIWGSPDFLQPTPVHPCNIGGRVLFWREPTPAAVAFFFEKSEQKQTHINPFRSLYWRRESVPIETRIRGIIIAVFPQHLRCSARF